VATDDLHLVQPKAVDVGGRRARRIAATRAATGRREQDGQRGVPQAKAFDLGRRRTGRVRRLGRAAATAARPKRRGDQHQPDEPIIARLSRRPLFGASVRERTIFQACPSRL
jgi:hypothetical protein